MSNPPRRTTTTHRTPHRNIATRGGPHHTQPRNQTRNKNNDSLNEIPTVATHRRCMMSADPSADLSTPSESSWTPCQRDALARSCRTNPSPRSIPTSHAQGPVSLHNPSADAPHKPRHARGRQLHSRSGRATRSRTIGHSNRGAAQERARNGANERHRHGAAR